MMQMMSLCFVTHAANDHILVKKCMSFRLQVDRHVKTIDTRMSSPETAICRVVTRTFLQVIEPFSSQSEVSIRTQQVMADSDHG